MQGSPTHQRRLRADLQGMRAIAVLAVIFYHFKLGIASGGFVGVDVFFVLSGFFITRLLYRDMAKHGHIRLGRFWANRAKRLLPNGLLTIICVIAATAALLPAYRFPNVAENARAAAAFFANFHFQTRAVDYFHLDDPASPLLHYWSLAIEEQFYLVLPLLMAALALVFRGRRPAALLSMLVLAIVVSFTLSLVAIEESQPAAFYFPWNRAWQLAAGGFVGMLFESRERVPALMRGLAALAGFAGVLASITLYSDYLLYPGLWASAPTFATVAVIYGLDAGRVAAPLSRFLGSRPMAWIGDLSYSLYLWHWPVSIFAAELWPQGGVVFIAGGLAATVLLSALAYYLVERPVHYMQLPDRDIWRPLVAGAAGVGLTVAAASVLPLLVPPANAEMTARIAEASADRGPNYGNGCHLDLKVTEQPACRFGHIGGPRVVLFGDSHAAQWFAPLEKAATEAGWELDVWTKTSCPTADIEIWYPGTRAVYLECDAWRAARWNELRANPPALVVIGNFNNYYGWIHDESRSGPADRATSERLWREGMLRTSARLAAIDVQVLEMRDTPRMYASYRDCLSKGDWNACTRPRHEALSGMESPRTDTPRYTVLDLSDVLCSAATCPAAIDEMIAYHDSHHMRAKFSTTLYRHFLPFLSAGK